MFSIDEYRRRVAAHYANTGHAPTAVYLGVDEVAGLRRAVESMIAGGDPRLKEIAEWKPVTGEANNPLFIMGIEVFAVNRQTHCRFVTVLEQGR